MLHSEILADIRQEHRRYPAANLTNYLRELQSDKRGPLIRKGQDGRFRFVDPISHTYAQAILDVREGRPQAEDRHQIEQVFEIAVGQVLDQGRLPLDWGAADVRRRARMWQRTEGNTLFKWSTDLSESAEPDPES
jgi:hypothetical protein